MPEPTYRPGSWPDIGVLPDGRVVLTYLNRKLDPPALTCEIAGVRAWQVQLPEGGLYQRMAVSPSGRIICAWQGGGTGLLTVVIDGGVAKTYGPTKGQNVCGCYWIEQDAVVVVQRTSTTFDRLLVPSGTLLERLTVPATSQGVRDVLPDGLIILGDAARSLRLHGWALLQPMTRGLWTVGQAEPPAAIRLAGPDRVFVAIPGDGYEPHVAVSGDTVYVCARTHKGAALAVLQPPYPAHEPPVVDVPVIGRRLWCGWFTFGVPFPDPLPGNCDLRVMPEMLVRTFDGKAVAAYVAGTPDGDVDSLERNVQSAKRHGLPVLAYWTWQAQMKRVPVGAEWVGVEAYRLTTESLASFEARVRGAVSRCSKVALICQCYTSNTRQTSDLASLVPVYARIAKDCHNVVALLVFSGSGRATGLQDHPEVRPLWEALAAGIPGPPELEDDVLNEPGVDILGVEPVGPDKTCTLVTFRNRNNPEHGVFEVTLDEGIARVEIVNAGGRDRSGKRPERKVI